jgi:glycosyltransferase involved in cell wall biosynthesis
MVKNVVIVSEAADGKGGASLAALASASALARAGIQTRVFAATGPFQPKEPAPAGLEVRTLQDGLDLVRAPRLQRATQSLWNRPAADAFADFVRALNPSETVVHVHSFHVQLTASVVRKAIDMGYPVVMTAHDYGMACPYSGFYNYGEGKPCGKRALSLGCATTLCTEGRSVPGKVWHLAKASVQASLGRVPKGVDHFVFLSDFSRRILAPYLPPDAPKSIVPNPLDFPKEPPRALPPGAPFLFAGRLTREKGARLFAEATKELGVPALVAGTGPEEETLCKINPEIELLGWQSPAQVRELMKRSRALVFPSLWYEGQPLTVQEAQSVGLPVVTSDVCAASATVEDGVDGTVFRSGDVSDLVRKMRPLLDEGTATRMGKAAYEGFWKDPPTAEAHVTRSLAVYESVLRVRP